MCYEPPLICISKAGNQVASLPAEDDSFSCPCGTACAGNPAFTSLEEEQDIDDDYYYHELLLGFCFKPDWLPQSTSHCSTLVLLIQLCRVGLNKHSLMLLVNIVAELEDRQ